MVKKILLTLLLVVPILTFIAAHFIAPYVILQPTRSQCHFDSNDDNNQGIHKIELMSKDSIVLSGFEVFPQTDSIKGAMILIHGIGGNKCHFTNLAYELSTLGIVCLVFDNRAHGESGGIYTTYGYKEKEDISILVDYIKSKDPNLKIGIWGNSLGGAIALQALAYDERIEFGIIESTFADLEQIVIDYKKRLTGISLPFIAKYALVRAGKIADFEPSKVSPRLAAKKINQPIQMAHGTADKHINIKYGKAIFNNLQHPDKKFIEVEGGLHANLYTVGGQDFKNKQLNFLQKQFDD